MCKRPFCKSIILCLEHPLKNLWWICCLAGSVLSWLVLSQAALALIDAWRMMQLASSCDIHINWYRMTPHEYGQLKSESSNELRMMHSNMANMVPNILMMRNSPPTGHWMLKAHGDAPGRWKCRARMKKLLLAICLAGQVWMDMQTSWTCADVGVV